MSEQPNTYPGIDLDQFDRWDYDQKRAGLDTHAGHRESALLKYRRLVEHLRRRAGRDERDRELYELAVANLSIDELTHVDLVAIARRHGGPISHADSFFRSIAIRRRKKQLGPVPEKYLGIGEQQDRLFAEVLGIRTPTVFYTGTFDAIPVDLRTDVVLKPVSLPYSRGAFYVFDETNIYSVEHSEVLTSWDELSEAIVAQFGAESLEERIWRVDELVYESDKQLARELKFYAFYGKIGLIQEVISRPFSPSMQHEYFNEDLTAAVCGRDHEPRFRDKSMTITDHGGMSSEKLRAVQWISEQIPAPFMRIDCLNAESELVFVELSSAPGRADSLNDAYDKLLGRYYNEAEIRLANDLLAGKQFEAFREFSQRLAPEQPSEPADSESPTRQSWWRQRWGSVRGL